MELAKKIRKFEVDLLKDFKKGLIPGTIHCCIGQEYDQVNIIKQLTKDDIVVSNHRCHGHYLAYTKDFKGLRDELEKKETGINKGKGLSQHLHNGNFYSSGVQGGFVPIACGMAMAEKINNTDNIVVCFIGDGTLGQGVLYESLNLASLWKLPIVFVLENNQYAMSTRADEAIAGSIHDRFEAFGIAETDIDNIKHNLPGYLVLKTYRFCGHSGRDSKVYRSKLEEDYWLKKDKLGGYLCEDIL